MNLFQQGNFTLNSGIQSPLKIECDMLAVSDWTTLAKLVSERFEFSGVHGVPTGGFTFSEALRPYATENEDHPFLLADDVLTTGGSMERAKEELDYPNIIGIVVFARNPPPKWIYPIFQMWT